MIAAVPRRILVLGAGFGGLELATTLSEALGDAVAVTLIDKADAFVFGYAKLDVMFGRKAPADVRLPYSALAKPGVRFLQETVAAIDPVAKRVRTDAAEHEADVLVIALGADYDYDATPGLAKYGNEFYSLAGAERLAGIVAEIREGEIVVGVCGAPFKCPPAPSEAALLMHDLLCARGVRERCRITLAMPFQKPVPPSPETSEALLGAFAERGIEFVASRRVAALDGERKQVVLDDGGALPYDIFLGVPRHRAAAVVGDSGLTDGDYVPVEPRTLATRFPDVYAIGDVADAGVPKAGVFAEGGARVVAAAVIAQARGEGESSARFDGRGSCYVEFGSGRVGRVDVDFLSGPQPSGSFQAPSDALLAEKRSFGASRSGRWFGL